MAEPVPIPERYVIDHRVPAALAQELTTAAHLQLVVSLTSPWFSMKGPVLAERVYPDPRRRASGDLDVVVPPADLRSAIAGLEAAGAQILDANWDVAIADRVGQVHLRLPYGTVLDLHWHLVNAGPVRDTLAVNMADVWRDLRTVDVGGIPVPTMSVTNTVVHVALHAGLGGAWQRKWFDDMRLLAEHEDVDWAAVVARARRWRVTRLVGVALTRAVHLADANIPADVLRALLPPPLTPRVVGSLDRVLPPKSARHEGSPARLWPNVTRDRWPDVARAGAWRLRRRARGGLVRSADAARIPEMLRPSGGPGGRERYLRLVESGRFDRTTRTAGRADAAG